MAMSEALKKKLDTIRPLFKGEDGKALWDVLVCLRGPDSPSERPNQPSPTRESNYAARVDRKMKTVAIIRGNTFPGVGSARCANGDTVYLPPPEGWDHFDKHVDRAARALGLKVKIEQPIEKGQVVAAHIAEPPKPPKPSFKPVNKVLTQAQLLGVINGCFKSWGVVTEWPSYILHHVNTALAEHHLTEITPASQDAYKVWVQDATPIPVPNWWFSVVKPPVGPEPIPGVDMPNPAASPKLLWMSFDAPATDHTPVYGISPETVKVYNNLLKTDQFKASFSKVENPAMGSGYPAKIKKSDIKTAKLKAQQEAAAKAQQEALKAVKEPTDDIPF